MLSYNNTITITRHNTKDVSRETPDVKTKPTRYDLASIPVRVCVALLDCTCLIAYYYVSCTYSSSARSIRRQMFSGRRTKRRALPSIADTSMCIINSVHNIIINDVTINIILT